VVAVQHPRLPIEGGIAPGDEITRKKADHHWTEIKRGNVSYRIRCVARRARCWRVGPGLHEHRRYRTAGRMSYGSSP